MHRTWVMLIGLSVVCVPALGDEKKPERLTDPTEILKNVDAAAKAVKVASYKATFQGLGDAAERVPQVEGTVVMTGWMNIAPEKFRVEARVKRPGSSEVKHVTIGGNGDTYYLLDHDEKKAYVDIDPAVIGTTGRLATQLFTLEFVHPAPFNDELEGDKQELLGVESIGGVDCYKIHVVYKQERQRAVWHFGARDFLPRQRVDIFTGPDGESRRHQRTLTDLKIDPPAGSDVFAFTLPDGYERSDDFAP